MVAAESQAEDAAFSRGWQQRWYWSLCILVHWKSYRFIQFLFGIYQGKRTKSVFGAHNLLLTFMASLTDLLSGSKFNTQIFIIVFESQFFISHEFIYFLLFVVLLLLIDAGMSADDIYVAKIGASVICYPHLRQNVHVSITKVVLKIALIIHPANIHSRRYITPLCRRYLMLNTINIESLQKLNNITIIMFN